MRSRKSVWNYLRDHWNWVDMTTIPMTAVVNIHLLSNGSLIPYEQLRIMAAIASFLLVLKFYDWLRLFEQTSFYVSLLF